VQVAGEVAQEFSPDALQAGRLLDPPPRQMLQSKFLSLTIKFKMAFPVSLPSLHPA